MRISIFNARGILKLISSADESEFLKRPVTEQEVPLSGKVLAGPQPALIP